MKSRPTKRDNDEKHVNVVKESVMETNSISELPVSPILHVDKPILEQHQA